MTDLQNETPAAPATSVAVEASEPVTNTADVAAASADASAPVEMSASDRIVAELNKLPASLPATNEDETPSAAAVVKPDGGKTKPTDKPGGATADPAKPATAAASAADDAIDEAKMLEGVTNPATQERIRSLVQRTRAVESQRDEERAGRENAERVTTEMSNWMQTNGIQQEQLMSHLLVLEDYQRAANGDRAAGQRVKEQLNAALREVALVLGEALPGVDALESFPDLREQVALGRIDENLAVELAGQRNRQQKAQQQREAQSRQLQTQEQTQQVVTRAASEMQTWAQAMIKADPHADHKLAVISEMVADGTLGADPLLIVAQAKKLYAKIPPPAARPLPPPPTPLPRHAPTGAPPPPAKPITAGDRETRMRERVLQTLRGLPGEQ